MKKILFFLNLTILTSICYSQTEISVSEINEKLTVQDRWVVIEYYADWCAVCKKMKPDYKKIAEEYGDRIDFYSVDATEMNIQDFKINFPSVGYYFNDKKISSPSYLGKGLYTYPMFEYRIKNILETPNKKDSNYKPVCSMESLKYYAVGRVFADQYNDIFIAPVPPREERKKDDTSKVYSNKIFDGQIETNYTFTYIPNPTEVLSDEEQKEVNSMFYYELDENTTKDFVVVKVEFINPYLESRAVVYLGFDRAAYGCGFYTFTDTFFPDLD
jgi:thiol-disulfide isomerase/thioredoxin